MQNIQDVNCNCTELKVASDVLDKSTGYMPHEEDDKKFNNEKETTASLKEFEAVMNDLVLKSDHDIKLVSCNKRSLNTIAKRNVDVKQDIIFDDSQYKIKLRDILDIPDIKDGIQKFGL